METISGGPKPTFNANEVLQAVKLNQATKNWVATDVPDDSEGNIGDVVFIPGGPGGLPAVGGGKVLQVVRATDTAQRSTNNTDWESAELSVTISPTEPGNSIVLMSNGIYLSEGNSEVKNTGEIRIVNDNGDSVIGGTGGVHGLNNVTNSATNEQVTGSFLLMGYATPQTTDPRTYTVEYKSKSTKTAFYLRNNQMANQLYAIEIADVVEQP